MIGASHRPYDPRRPVVCPDEQPVRLLGETRSPPPSGPGQPRRYDYEDERDGTADLFLASAPLVGWRYVAAAERRTATDFGAFPRAVADEVDADAGRVAPGTDDLNAHGSAACTGRSTRRRPEEVEWHYPPKHGSWPNVAEGEFATLTRQCLNRRTPTVAELRRRVEAWENARNGRRVGAEWRFTTADARVKLRRLYPSTQ